MVVAASQDVMNVLKVGLKDHSDDLGVRNQRWGFATNDQRSYNPLLFSLAGTRSSVHSPQTCPCFLSWRHHRRQGRHQRVRLLEGRRRRRRRRRHRRRRLLLLLVSVVFFLRACQAHHRRRRQDLPRQRRQDLPPPRRRRRRHSRRGWNLRRRRMRP